ncbi:MAG: Flp family type IVb pilin [Parvibaculales bacterium]
MKVTFIKLMKDENGATAIEYGLIAAGIAVAIVTAVNQIGTDLTAMFTAISGKITGNTPS